MIGGAPHLQLITASEDAMLLWGIPGGDCDRLQRTDPPGGGDGDGEADQLVEHVAALGNRSCACIGLGMVVHDLETMLVAAWLDGHTARVTAAEFSPHGDATLVSVSEDRTFIIWDLAYACRIAVINPHLC